jgi:hypothetical protein
MLLRAVAPLGLERDHYLGAIPWIRVAGAILRSAPGDVEAARWRDDQWEMSGRVFTALELEGTSFIRFEDDGARSEWQGPFSRMRLAGGSLFADGVLIARFDEGSAAWTAKPHGRNWAGYLISAERIP